MMYSSFRRIFAARIREQVGQNRFSQGIGTWRGDPQQAQ